MIGLKSMNAQHRKSGINKGNVKRFRECDPKTKNKIRKTMNEKFARAKNELDEENRNVVNLSSLALSLSLSLSLSNTNIHTHI
jgi:hypothetical protein